MIELPTTAGVYGIYGPLGGGKSLCAVDIMLSFIRARHFVCSNVRLKGLDEFEAARFLYLEDISKVDWFSLPSGSPRGSAGKKRVAVVLDEMPELLDQYSSGRDYFVKSFLSWLRHTSKRGQFVFIITQDPSFVLKSVRLLCSYWIKCEDMAQLHLPFLALRLPFVGGYIIRRVYDRDGNCLTKRPDMVNKRTVGSHYDTAQGLSLYSTADAAEFHNAYDGYLARVAAYNRLQRVLVFSLALYILSLVCALL